jgi:surfeit locus 1 family protein
VALTGQGPRHPRSAGTLAILGILAVLGIAGLTALTVWQVERRSWKLDLIGRVEQRVGNPAVPAPGPSAWPTISAASDEYRPVTATGRFLHDREALVQAVTELGGGYWVMTPFQATGGFLVLVNRGFVPHDKSDPANRAGQSEEQTSITGLLRLSEPDGAFLRQNDPSANRWYSRDVAAIAAARGLQDIAPYFIDADATVNPGGWPVGGLTIVRFANNHLIYALTWLILDLMLIGGSLFVLRDEWRLRQQRRASTCS